VITKKIADPQLRAEDYKSSAAAASFLKNIPISGGKMVIFNHFKNAGTLRISLIYKN
jgi:hypothetical protein